MALFIVAASSWAVAVSGIQPAEGPPPPHLLPGADTPPRGLNTRDSFRYWATEADLLANAKVMSESGMVRNGWSYLVVDEGWYRWSNNTSLEQQHHEDLPTANAVRNQSWCGVDAHGRFTPSLDRFPSAAGGRGLKPLCAKMAQMGVLCGVHLINGLPQVAATRKLPILGGGGATCADIVTANGGGAPPMTFTLKEPLGAGARAYFKSLVAQLQGWGVRFIKWDFGPSAAEIAMMVELIEQANASILLSVNAGPQPLATMYRISNDVWDVWTDVTGNVQKIADHLKDQKPGHWPDADMLPLGRIGGLRSPLWDKGCGKQVGKLTALQLNCGWNNQSGFRCCECCPRQSRLTATEARTLLGLWYISRSPLFFGGYLPQTDAETIAMLTDSYALLPHTRGRNVTRQVNSTGVEGSAAPGVEAWISNSVTLTAAAAGSNFFVGLFNFGDAEANATVTATLPPRCKVIEQVMELWAFNTSVCNGLCQKIAPGVSISTLKNGSTQLHLSLGPHDSSLLSVSCSGATRAASTAAVCTNASFPNRTLRGKSFTCNGLNKRGGAASAAACQAAACGGGASVNAWCFAAGKGCWTGAGASTSCKSPDLGFECAADFSRKPPAPPPPPSPLLYNCSGAHNSGTCKVCSNYSGLGAPPPQPMHCVIGWTSSNCSGACSGKEAPLKTDDEPKTDNSSADFRQRLAVSRA